MALRVDAAVVLRIHEEVLGPAARLAAAANALLHARRIARPNVLGSTGCELLAPGQATTCPDMTSRLRPRSLGRIEFALGGRHSEPQSGAPRAGR